MNRAALVTGTLFISQVAALRAFASADSQHVWILGRELEWACSFQLAFGIPCPNCGMTRSMILFVHGAVADALRLNPAGPLLVLAMLAAGVILVLRGTAQTAPSFRANRLIPGAVGLYVATLIGQWALKLGGRF